MKKRKTFILSLFVASIAICLFFGLASKASVKAEESSTNKDAFLSYFTAVGDNGLVDRVKNISYGEFTADNFSGGGVMVETRNKTSELASVTEDSNETNPALINMPDVKYSTGVKFNGTIDLSDNTSDVTLLEVAFPGTNDNVQVRGFKVVIEDASNPDKYISLFIWSAYGNYSPSDGSKDHVLAAAVASWETTDPNNIANAAFDTDDYNNDGNTNDGCLVKVTESGIDGGTAENGKEICWLNAGSPHGHAVTSVKFSNKSNNTFKIQFDNETGEITNYSELYKSY